MQLLLMAQKPIGEWAFARFVEELRPAVAVSNPQPVGWWRSAGVRDLARHEQIPFISNATRNTKALQRAMQDYRIDCIVSVQHPWVLPGELLSVPAYNLHLAPLPQYRGWHGASHAIAQGKTSFGWTIHTMDRQVDRGNVVYSGTVPVRTDDTARRLYDRTVEAAKAGIKALIADLKTDSVPRGSPMLHPGTYYGRQDIEAYRRAVDFA